MQINLEKIEKATAFVNITATPTDIEREETHTLEHLAAETTIKGFRKGKAPLNIVKNSLDPEKIKQRTVSHLLGHALNDAIKEHSLKVVGNPRLVKSETEKETWQFSLELPLYPDIKLGDYQKAIQGSYEKKTPKNEDEKLKIAFDSLLETPFDISQILIDEEVDRSLARLVQQTESLNISVQDYLKSLKKTPADLRKDYQKTATDSLKLDFLLFAVATDLKIKVEESEVLELEKASQTKPEQRTYLQTVLLRRKAVDSLLKL